MSDTDSITGTASGNSNLNHKGKIMKKRIATLAGLIVFAGIAQGNVIVPTGLFNTEGISTQSTLSNISTTGFTRTYNSPLADVNDTRALVYSQLNNGQQDIGVGDWVKFSFDFSSTQIADAKYGFRFGFDTGVGCFGVVVDTQPAYTFLQFVYGDAYPFGTLLGAGSVNSNHPPSSAWLAAGNTPHIEFTLTRLADEDWVMEVDWAGTVYTSSVIAGYSTDNSIDSAWIGSGGWKDVYMVAGDNYTISNASVTMIPEPATTALLALGALLPVLMRRSRRM